MPDDETFEALILRLAQGDETAAEELVRRYEAVVRLEVRCWMGRSLRRQLDSIDICQAVWASFFVRERSPDPSHKPYRLENPSHLIALLKDIARKKVFFEARKLKAGMRDGRQVELNADPVFDCRASVSQLVIEQELNQHFLGKLKPLVRRIFDLLGTGLTWRDVLSRIDPIATELGVPVPIKEKNVGALRKWYNREMRRVADTLGLI